MVDPTTDLAARFEAKREEAVEAAARAYYDGMIGRPEDQWPHHDGWAGKSEAFKAKVRVHMARALEAAADQARDMARADAAGGAGERVRHMKSGGEYEVLGEAKAQVSTGETVYANVTGGAYQVRELKDYDRLSVYRGGDGQLWARFTDEFRDGRFETIAAVPPPPAQQGSSSPLREGETAGELERLSEAAPKGTWHPDEYEAHDEDGGPSEICCDGVITLDSRGETDSIASCTRRVAEYVCALVNAHRSGHLVPAPLATARDGGTGAPRTRADLPPVGHDAEDPTGWSKISAVAREASGLDQEALADIYNDWLTRLPEDQQNPHQFKAFLAGVALVRDVGTGAGDGLNGLCIRNPAPDAAAPAVTNARTVTIGRDAPTPDPRKEALAVLEEIPRWATAEEFARAFRYLGRPAEADRIEAALATLSAADQDGEVRS